MLFPNFCGHTLTFEHNFEETWKEVIILLIQIENLPRIAEVWF